MAKAALKRYSKSHAAPGDFLRAMLSNNLQKTMQYADPGSLENLKEIFNFMWSELPGNIWGSPEAVKAHLEKPPEMPV